MATPYTFRVSTLRAISAKPGLSVMRLKVCGLKPYALMPPTFQLAAWCGPCRRENPNVVQTYEKYKKDGFTIVSVSLDTDAQKWKNAIEQDQLSWPNHVSDLGGWNSKVAQLYKVSSVPFTVLIDREGHVIKTNLRGPALEEELKRIFGH